MPTAKLDAAVPISRSAVAAEAGFSERQAKTAQRIAAIPEDAFEDMVERGATVTELASAGTQTREPNRDEARRLLAVVKVYAEKLDQINLDEAIDALLPTTLLNSLRLELRCALCPCMRSYHGRTQPGGPLLSCHSPAGTGLHCTRVMNRQKFPSHRSPFCCAQTGRKTAMWARGWGEAIWENRVRDGGYVY